MYNHYYDKEKMSINDKEYSVNYLVTCYKNVLGLHYGYAYYLLVHSTDDEIMDNIHLYQNGVRCYRKSK